MNEHYELRAPKSLMGERVDKAVAMLLDCTRSQASSLVEMGAVLINSHPTKLAQKIQENDLLELTYNPADFISGPPKPDARIEVNVIFEDADLVILDKPAGLVVHPGAGNPDKTLVNGLLACYPELKKVGEVNFRPGIVHRLDKDTSGVMLVARTQASYENLVTALKHREINRIYHAVVWGVLENEAGIIDAPLTRSMSNRTKMSINSKGKPARTHYKLLEQYLKGALLECKLESGRTHQIRVHLAAIGHPVMGDLIYGGKERLNSELEDFLPNRLALHAKHISLSHPITNEPLEFSVEMPTDLLDWVASIKA